MNVRYLFFSPLLLLAVASCVELTGQRISLRHDEQKDELQILLCHDGIHESPPSRNAEGSRQIPEYVMNGDVLFLDWPGHVEMRGLRRLGDRDAARPAIVALGEAVTTSLRSTAVGRYRDSQGRVGAVQLVVISRAKDFIAKVNAAISEELLREPYSGDSPLTAARMREAAGKGQRWVSLEGHSLRFAFPAHPAEWAVKKAVFVQDLVKAWKDAQERKEDSNDVRPEFLLQLLALSPLSIEESSDGVSIRLGDPKRPVPLRFALRDAYNSKLEMAVSSAVPAEVDETLARYLTGDASTKASPGVKALADWGPPEDSARALVLQAGSKNASERAGALERLRTVGDSWNRGGNRPPAPAPGDQADAYLEAWRGWYRGVTEP